VEVWQTSNLRRLRLGEEKKKKERRRKNKAQHENIMVCPIPYGDHKNGDISASFNYRPIALTIDHYIFQDLGTLCY